MAARIEIDGVVLAQEITTLRALRARRVVDTTSALESKGLTAGVAGDLAGLFVDADAALDQLIDQTVAFLVNVEDGFADVDQEAADAATRLEVEVSGG